MLGQRGQKLIEPLRKNDVHKTPSRSSELDTPIPIGSRRNYGQIISGIIAAIVIALIAISIFRNHNIDHHTIARYLFSAPVLQGLKVTIELAVAAEIVGIAFGMVLALARQSRNRVWASLSWMYIWGFRGTPLLVQIIFWGNIALLFPHLGLSIPGTSISLWSVKTNHVVTPFAAAVLALGLNEAAYQAEVFRGGLLAVGQGQRDAARALGMNNWQVNKHVVFPQALRIVVPPTGNQFISLLKASSLVSVIAGGDLLSQVENIYATNYKTIELLIVAALWYITLTSLTYVGQHFLEVRANRSVSNPSHRDTGLLSVNNLGDSDVSSR